jgi:hypothetical protein
MHLSDLEIADVKIIRRWIPIRRTGSLVIAGRTMALYTAKGQLIITAPLSKVRASAHRFRGTRVHLTADGTRFTLNGSAASGHGPGWLTMPEQTGFGARFLIAMDRAGVAVKRERPIHAGRNPATDLY